jgi:hypothetical protein
MTPALPRISVSRRGREQVLSVGNDPVSDVGSFLRAHTDSSDVTLSIELPDDHGTLLVALESGSAFVGLERPEGVYQYVANAASMGQREFIIGGQSTSVDTRYVLPIPAAIQLVTSCLGESEPVAGPAWERQ